MKNKKIEKQELKVGDKVNVYNLSNPRRDLKCTSTILDFDTIGGTPVAWLEGVRGAWAIEALEKVESSEV